MFQLKNIKYFQAMSEETHCYTASLYLNNCKVGEVKNAGHGGCDDVYYENEGARAAVENALAKLEPPKRTDREKAELIRSRITRLSEIGDCSYDPVMCQEPDHVLIENHADLLEKDWMNPDLESICCDLMNKWLWEKDLKRAMAKRVLFTRTDGDGIYQTAAARNAKERDHWAGQLREKIKNVDQVLNCMPIGEAVKLYMERVQ